MSIKEYNNGPIKEFIKAYTPVPIYNITTQTLISLM